MYEKIAQRLENLSPEKQELFKLLLKKNESKNHTLAVDNSAETHLPSNTKQEPVIPAAGEYTENLLIKIWENALGLKGIKVTDNFFTLGGDSLKAIYMISNLHKHHMTLTMQDLLQNQTIKDLCKHLKPSVCKAEQGLVTGECPLMPVQKNFFEHKFSDPHYWTMPFVLFRKEGFNDKILYRIFQHILEHHDALRIVFRVKDGELVQYNRGHEENLFPFSIFDITGETDGRSLILEKGYALQNSLNLESGPLLGVALFKAADGDYLLIAVHHLVFDVMSMKILLEDLESAYLQVLRGEEIRLQEKTASWLAWSRQIHLKANSSAFLEQLPYWQAIEAQPVAALPRDHRLTAPRLVGNTTSVKDMLLDDEQSRYLLTEVNSRFGTTSQEIILTALGQALSDWTGENKVLFRLGAHGRDLDAGGLNINRTIGWFSISYPVMLDMSHKNHIPIQVARVKEQLRSIPGKGEGYDMLKYATLPEKRQNRQFRLHPEIYINNLGDYGNNLDKSNTLQVELGSSQFSRLPVPANRSIRTEREYTFVFTIGMYNGKWYAEFDYDKDEYNTDTVKNLLGNFKDNLLKIISMHP